MNDEKNLIKIAFYVGIFVIAFIIIMIDKKVSENDASYKENKVISGESIIEEIKNINDLFYSASIYIFFDDDVATLSLEKNKEVELFFLKYHGNETKYISYNNSYYLVTENNLIKTDDFNIFPFNITFIYLNNIKKLLDLKCDISENDEGILITYDIKSVLDIYNAFNNTKFISEDNSISLKLYKENDINHMDLNLTSLYNLIYGTNYNKVIYNMTFKSSKEEDMSWLIERMD